MIAIALENSLIGVDSSVSQERPVGADDVDLCERALMMIAREANPELWATLQIELAKSLGQNPRGDRARNLEWAIRHNEQATAVRRLNGQDDVRWTGVIMVHSLEGNLSFCVHPNGFARVLVSVPQGPTAA